MMMILDDKMNKMPRPTSLHFLHLRDFGQCQYVKANK